MPGRWWVISEDSLLRALRKCADGGNPDIILLELTANSAVEHVEGD